jgi:hypothetical protein
MAMRVSEENLGITGTERAGGFPEGVPIACDLEFRPRYRHRGETAGELSTPFQKFANVSRNRLLTRAAPIGAATVRERSSRDTRPYLRNSVLS